MYLPTGESDDGDFFRSTLVIQNINLIAGDIDALTPYGQMTLETYLSDPINEVIAERYLERIKCLPFRPSMV